MTSPSDMKPLLWSALLAALLLTGCAARRYTITLNNGNTITARSKPRLVQGSYVYKDLNGKEAYLAAGRVREIAPSNMATPRIKSGFSAETIK